MKSVQTHLTTIYCTNANHMKASSFERFQTERYQKIGVHEKLKRKNKIRMQLVKTKHSIISTSQKIA